jgi:hypothetical protein
MSWRAFLQGVASLLDIFPRPLPPLRTKVKSALEAQRQDAENLRGDWFGCWPIPPGGPRKCQAPYGRHDDGRPITAEEAQAWVQKLKDAGLIQVTEFSPAQLAEIKRITDGWESALERKYGPRRE